MILRMVFHMKCRNNINKYSYKFLSICLDTLLHLISDQVWMYSCFGAPMQIKYLSSLLFLLIKSQCKKKIQFFFNCNKQCAGGNKEKEYQINSFLFTIWCMCNWQILFWFCTYGVLSIKQPSILFIQWSPCGSNGLCKICSESFRGRSHKDFCLLLSAI